MFCRLKWERYSPIGISDKSELFNVVFKSSALISFLLRMAGAAVGRSRLLSPVQMPIKSTGDRKFG